MAWNPSLIRYRAKDKNDQWIFLCYYDFIDGEGEPDIPLGRSKALFEEELLHRIPFGMNKNIIEIKFPFKKKEPHEDELDNNAGFS